MVAASLALHGAVGTSIFIGHSSSVSAPISPESKPENLVLLSSTSAPGIPQPIAPSRSPSRPVTTAVATTVPVTAKVEKAKEVVTTPPPASLALEANPNAHIRALPPEEVLSPSPAPQLNGSDGVVFILDVSGSMYEKYDGSTRLAQARETLTHHIRGLKDGTPFAATLYAGAGHNSGPLVAASDATREAAVRFIGQNIDCGGGTNLPEGLAAAQKLQAGHIVLVTDGDLNVSVNELMDKAREILGPEGQGPGLTIIGISPRPKTDAMRLMKNLVAQRNGAYVSAEDDGTQLISSNR